MADNTTKVLFLSLSGIGNYLMQSPTIAALKKAHPDWHVTVWVAPRGTKALAENDPHVDQVIEMPIKTSVSGHILQIAALRKHHFDIGIVLSPGQLLKSAAYLFFAAIPKRIGHTYPLLKNEHSSFLLTDAIDEVDATHDIEQNLYLLQVLGIRDKENKQYELSLPPNARQTANQMFLALKIPDNKLVIGIHAGSAPDFIWKRWPLDRFASVAKTLIATKNAHILIFGGSNEESQKQELATLIGSDYSIVSADLLTTVGIMTHCDYLISNDSGLMHVASASGVKVYGLFGPTDEAKTGPRGRNAVIIRAPGTTTVYDTEQNYNLGSSPHETILAITPEMVLDKLA